MPFVDLVDTLFAKLADGQTDKFFEHVWDNVTWTVHGTHALAGVYRDKNTFLKNALGEVRKRLKGNWTLKIKNIIVSNYYDTAVVEMESLSVALNGKPFNNTYCWIVHFQRDVIVRVDAYVDSVLVQQLLDENPID
ncbi:MAG: ketosteroid isomerase [bacterium]|nr:ketosteroid isomerase [bacterium]